MKKRKMFQKETVQWNFCNRGNGGLDLDGSTNTLSVTNVYIFLT